MDPEPESTQSSSGDMLASSIASRRSHNSVQPALRLPFELLGGIFAIGSPSVDNSWDEPEREFWDVTEYRQHRTAIGSTCSMFREVLNGTSRCWTHIPLRLRYDDFHPCLEYLKLCFERSSLFDLEVTRGKRMPRSGLHDTGMDALHSLLELHLDRCRALLFTEHEGVEEEDDLEGRRRLVENIPLPSLTTIYMRMPRSGIYWCDEVMENTLSPVLAMASNPLCTVSFHLAGYNTLPRDRLRRAESGLRLLTPMPLTKLSIGGGVASALVIERLRCLPGLRHLRWATGSYDDTCRSQGTLVFPELRTLALLGNAAFLMPRVEAPLLEHLYLKRGGTRPVDIFPPLPVGMGDGSFFPLLRELDILMRLPYPHVKTSYQGFFHRHSTLERVRITTGVHRETIRDLILGCVPSSTSQGHRLRLVQVEQDRVVTRAKAHPCSDGFLQSLADLLRSNSSVNVDFRGPHVCAIYYGNELFALTREFRPRFRHSIETFDLSFPPWSGMESLTGWSRVSVPGGWERE